MNTIERKRAVMQCLEQNGSANIIELAKDLHVSSMTIRRDLARFAKEGLVRMEYGGAVLNKGSLFEYNMSMKKEQNLHAKRAIAKEALKYVKDGDSIFLDAGTSIAELAKLLINRTNLNILTDSLLSANVLSGSEKLRLVMCPGVYRERSMAFMGQLTDSFVDHFTIDVLFLAVEGIDTENGLTVQDITDGETKHHLVSKAKKTICLADSSKFNKKYFYEICGINDVDILITDDALDDRITEQLGQQSITVVRVPLRIPSMIEEKNKETGSHHR